MESKRSAQVTLIFTLLVPALFLSLGRGFIAPVLPVLARDEFVVSPAMAGLTVIAPLVGNMVATIPTGYLADRLGRRGMLVIGPLLTAVTAALLFVATSYLMLIVFLMLNGISQQMWQVTRLAAIVDSSRQSQRGTLINTMAALQRFGNLTGPLFGGVVGELMGLRAPFLMYAFMGLISMIAMFRFMKETFPEEERTPRSSGRSSGAEGEASGSGARPGGGSWSGLLTPTTAILWTSNFAANIARGGARGVAGPYFIFAAYGFGSTPAELGGIAFVAGLVSVPLTVLAGRLMDRVGRKAAVVPGCMTVAAGLGFMAATAAADLPFAAFLVAFLLIYMGGALMAGSMQTMGGDLAPAHARGKFFGVQRTVASAGTLINPSSFSVITAMVAGSAGFAAAFSFTGGFGALAGLLVALFVKETLVKEKHQEPGSRPREPRTGDSS